MKLRLLTPRRRTLTLTALGIGAVIATETWDARHEASAALEDLMHDHVLLARALAGTVERREPGPSREARAVSTRTADEICQASAHLGRAGEVVVVVQPTNGVRLRECGGRDVAVPSLAAAMRTSQPGVTLSRAEAERLGLPARVAVAGIAVLPPGGGVAALAVAGSAGSERDRSRRQQARTIISMAVVSALILGFGLSDLRRQRRELDLERQVELEKATQERDAELAKATRMATLAALASSFAHEIGTPLGILSGRIEQLRAGGGSEERRRELLGQAAFQVERVSNLIRSFLGFARGDAAILVRVPAVQLVESALRLVRHRFASASVGLELDTADAAGTVVACAPALLEQVVVNVLVNALEASVAGQTVALRLERDTDDLVVAVTDAGSGISREVMARVTEPFFTTKARTGGTGLGLTIVKEIVAHHRGELVIRRRPTNGEGASGGTEVVVRIPRAVGA